MGVHGRGKQLLSGFAKLTDVEVTHIIDPDENVFSGQRQFGGAVGCRHELEPFSQQLTSQVALVRGDGLRDFRRW